MNSGANGVVNIVIDISHAVANADDLAFQRATACPFCSHLSSDSPANKIAFAFGMVQNAVAHFPGQIETVPAVFEFVHDAQRMFVVAKTRFGSILAVGFVERFFADVSKRRVTHIVAHANGFGQIFVQTQRARDGARNLRDFERVGEARAIVIEFGRNENLCFVLEAAETLWCE